jgi:predicted MPP superfamily phosphohydrolase
MNSAVSGSSKINKFNPQNYKGFKKFVDKDAWWVLILVGSLFMLFMIPLILGLKQFKKKKQFWTSFKEGVRVFFYSFIFMLLHHNPIVKDSISRDNLVANESIGFIICYLYIPIILSLIAGFLLRALNDSQKQNKNNKYKTIILLIFFWGFFFVLVVYLLVMCGYVLVRV